MGKRDPTAEALAALTGAHDLPAEARRDLLRKNLANRSNWVVAKAAKIAGEVRDAGLAADLVAAFHRLMADPEKLDKRCAALTEIAAAISVSAAHLLSSSPKSPRRSMPSIIMIP